MAPPGTEEKATWLGKKEKREKEGRTGRDESRPG